MSIDFSDTGFETQEPLVTTSLTRDDENEGSLRPKTLREYIGQEKAKGNLEVFIQAAKMRGEPLDHVLLHGPPGLFDQRGEYRNPVHSGSPMKQHA